MAGQSRIVDFESERLQIFGDELRGSLLSVESERERLDSSKEEERVESGKTVSDRVDRESDSLPRMSVRGALLSTTKDDTPSRHPLDYS